MKRISSLLSACLLLLMVIPACCWECKKCDRGCKTCPSEERGERRERKSYRQKRGINNPLARREAMSQDEEDMSPQEEMRYEEEDY